MEIDYNKYTEESLEFIYSEGQKHFDELTKAFREITTKSYIVISVLLSFMGYLAHEIINSQELMNTNGILFICLMYPALLIFTNTLPNALVIGGAQPKLMQHSYFEYSLDDQYKKYLVQRISDCQQAIIDNGKLVNKRAKRLRYALILIFTSFIMPIIFWFWIIS